MGWEYKPEDAVLGLPEGEYEAVIAKVEDTTSKKGNEMRVITFTVYGNGQEFSLSDYFVKGNNIAIHRMKKLAQALGKEPEFMSAKFDAAKCVGTSLTVGLKVEGEYNKIGEYKTLQRSTKAAAAAVKDDDIPF